MCRRERGVSVLHDVMAVVGAGACAVSVIKAWSATLFLLSEEAVEVEVGCPYIVDLRVALGQIRRE